MAQGRVPTVDKIRDRIAEAQGKIAEYSVV
jgi:hypothetical protein